MGSFSDNYNNVASGLTSTSILFKETEGVEIIYNKQVRPSATLASQRTQCFNL